MKQSSLRIFTSYVSEENLKTFIDLNYLPIFIIRCISRNPLTVQWAGSSIHFVELSPTSPLYQMKRDHKISIEEFNRRYLEELEAVDLNKEIDKMEYLASLCNANGVILLGYGEDYDLCHRKVFSELLNDSGLLEFPVTEIKLC